jgi:DNA-binding PadR family transcriptional regulator
MSARPADPGQAPVKRLTSTSYAVLGLVAAGPATAYELATQVARGLRFVWPRAEGRIYDEPKLLAAHGLAHASKERTGRRPRTIYSITEDGRRSLRRWIAEPAAGPVLEYEALLKVVFARCGSRADLLRHLSAISGHAAANLAVGRTRADEYASQRVPLPEHLAINALMWKFLWQFYSAIQDWAAWAAAEVSRWPEDLHPTADTHAWAMDLFRSADPPPSATRPRSG